MLALRFAALLALTVWVGGVIVLGGIAAPAAFDVMASRQVPDGRVLAGAVVGEALRRLHLLSYVCGGLMLLSLSARAVLGPRPTWFAFRIGFVAVMLAASAYSGLVVAKRIDRLRAEIGVAPSSLAESDPRRVAFGRLHGASSALQLVPILGGLVLLFLELKD